MNVFVGSQDRYLLGLKYGLSHAQTGLSLGVIQIFEWGSQPHPLPSRSTRYALPKNKGQRLNKDLPEYTVLAVLLTDDDWTATPLQERGKVSGFGCCNCHCYTVCLLYSTDKALYGQSVRQQWKLQHQGELKPCQKRKHFIETTNHVGKSKQSSVRQQWKQSPHNV